MISRRNFVKCAVALALAPVLPLHITNATTGVSLVRRRLRAADRAVRLRIAAREAGEFQLFIGGNGLWIHDIALEAREGQRAVVHFGRHVPPRRATAWMPLPAGPLSMTVQVTNLPLGQRTTVLELRTRAALPATA
ncbi:MAG: hypothetical protein NTU78_02515 [Alphaproteobacteria bacterium]|nr:hypothetical protein [Alphaproteobacteria bacterium]